MGYNDDKEPDSRIAHIRKTSEQAVAEPDPVPCKECQGMGEVAILNDEGEPTGGRKFCTHCQGAGVEPEAA